MRPAIVRVCLDCRGEGQVGRGLLTVVSTRVGSAFGIDGWIGAVGDGHDA